MYFYSEFLTKIKGIFEKNFKNTLRFDSYSIQKDEKFLNEKLTHLGGDIRVQGPRAKGSAKATSDIDIAILVDEKQFNELIHKYFKNPNPRSARERTMQHAQKQVKCKLVKSN